jgi:hypothetical protein
LQGAEELPQCGVHRELGVGDREAPQVFVHVLGGLQLGVADFHGQAACARDQEVGRDGARRVVGAWQKAFEVTIDVDTTLGDAVELQ